MVQLYIHSLLIDFKISGVNFLLLAPDIRLPGAHINERILFVKINEQKQVPLIRISGRCIALTHSHAIYFRGVIFLDNIERTKLQRDVLLLPEYAFLTVEKFFFTVNKAQDEVECSRCQGKAKKVFTAPSVSTSKNSIDKQFQEDPEEYREMHYHEKNKDWDKAAKAAEGVSDFAKRKFEKKAREEESG